MGHSKTRKLKIALGIFVILSGIGWLVSRFGLFPYLAWALGGTCASIFWTLVYLMLYDMGYESRVRLVAKNEKQFLSFLNRVELRGIWHRQREQSMITMGSLFIPTAFVLLGVASQPNVSCLDRIVLSLLSPLLYGVWLFTIQLSTRLMNDADIELQQYAQGIVGDFARLQRRLYGERHGNGRMMPIRRNHWLIYLWILIVGTSYLIQTSSCCWFR